MSMTRIAFMAGLMLCAGVFEAGAGTVAPVNLADLVEIAPRVFEGRCVNIEHNTVKSSDGKVDIPVARYTFEIMDSLRGAEAKQVVITQLGKFTDGRRFWANPDTIGVPSYDVGGHYVLFMTREGKAGLSSPIGMNQGVFRVENRRAKNMAGNAMVLRKMSEVLRGTPYQSLISDEQGLDLDNFKALVRDMIARKIQAPSLKREVMK